MLKCLIIDDEPLAIEVLRDYIQRHNALQLTNSCTDPYKGLSILQEQPIDLLFLDIQMPDLPGLALLEKLSHPPPVIFTTAHSEYAVKGFEVDAVDYLLKPFSYERFEEAIKKAKRILPATAEKSYTYIKSGYNKIKLHFQNILFIKSEKDYLRIYTNDRPSFLTLMSVQEMLDVLPDPNFIRVHRSYIVAIDKIDTIHPKQLQIGSYQIPVGPTYTDKIKELTNS